MITDRNRPPLVWRRHIDLALFIGAVCPDPATTAAGTEPAVGASR